MSNVKVAVVGCGYWGKNLVRNFAGLNALGAVVDPNAELAASYAKKYDVTTMTFDEALVSDDINGVVIAAPAELHAKLTLQAYSAGKHVYVEKPIALSMEDAISMADAAQKADRVLMVGHLLQYHPAFEALLKLVRSGELGAIRYAYSNRLSTGKFRVEENALWSLAPHDFSMLLAIFDEEPETVIGSGGGWVTPGIEDEYHVDMTFPSGGRAHIFASWLHPFKEQRLTVVGEKAMAIFEDSEPEKIKKLRLYRHKIDTSGREPVPVKADVEYVPFDMEAEPLKQECQHFLDCCRDNSSPRTDADEAMGVLRALIASAPN